MDWLDGSTLMGGTSAGRDRPPEVSVSAPPTPLAGVLQSLDVDGTAIDRDEAWLRSLLADLATTDVSSPTTLPPEPPVRRRWIGRVEFGDASPLCDVLRRHPGLRFAFKDLPEVTVRRHRRGFGWGIRKEFSSSVMEREMFAFSSLEFDALRGLELDAHVSCFIEQPMLIRYSHDGKRRFYRPDILAVRKGSLECYEVKFETDARLAETRWNAIGDALASIGIGYTVVTERHLRREPRHRNVRTVFLARHARPARALADRVVEWLRESGPVSARVLRQEFGLTFRETCCLVRHSLLSAELDAAPLDEGVLVAASDRGRRDIWAPRL